MAGKIGNLTLLLVIGLFGVAYFFEVQRLPLPEERLIVGILALLLVVLLAAEAGRTIYKMVAERKSKEEKNHNGLDAKLLVLLVSFTGYVLLFPWLGFFVTSLIFLTGLTVFLGSRNFWEYLTIPLGLLVLVYYIFAHLLHVRFPKGLLF